GGAIEGRSSTERAGTPVLDVERTVLSNGIVLLLGETHSIPAISINAVVNAGSRYEPEEKAGLASMLAEMLDEGTETRSAHQIAEQIEQAGGHLQTFGGYAQSGVSTTVLTSDLDLGFELTADVLMHAIFPQDRFDQQREDRKSTRLNSSHLGISYAVFCLKKKTIAVISSPQRKPRNKSNVRCTSIGFFLPTAL